MRRQAKKFAKGSPSDGSALILTVVLTSLLAMVGVLFVMMARVNQIATSGISESRELDSAIETVIAEISEELVLDVPGVSATNPDYYDYPGSNDEWLASLEPNVDDKGTPITTDDEYYWRQISDVTGYLKDKGWGRKDIDITNTASDLFKAIVEDHKEIELDDGDLEEQLADADGDGVADSKWIELDDITSSKGKPIYAAIRIVDNGGMLNVNTAYKFDPSSSDPCRVDGSSQTQINLAALCRGTTKPFSNLDDMRKGGEIWDLDSYIDEVVWRIEKPEGLWTPFDISDELKLRNRYIISKTSINTRIGDLWTKAFDWEPYVPRNEKYHSITEPNDWFWYVNNSSPDTNSYNYRHISTTYNMDRIIRPDGGRMLNINHDDPNVNVIYNAIRAGLIDGGITDPNSPAAQITVNLIDFRDNDSNVTSINVGGSTYYGFERPCVYISELAYRFKTEFMPGGTGPAPGIDYVTYRSYAIELYKPYSGDDDPNGWQIVIDNPPRIIPVSWSGTQYFHVIYFEDPCVPLVVDFNDPNLAGSVQEPPFVLRSKVFENGSLIELQRKVGADWISVDSIDVPDWLVQTPTDKEDEATRSFKRDITQHKCIRRLWSPEADKEKEPSLGHRDPLDYQDLLSTTMIQAHPENKPFTNIGEIGMVFRKSAYSEGPNTIGPMDTEADVRINFAEPEFRQVFNYLTVIDPASDEIDNDGDGTPDELNNPPVAGDELKVPGRININTAPWYVIAQLPWMQYTAVGDDYQRAQLIADNRGINGPYKNIGELMRVAEMRSLDLDDEDNLNTGTPRGPDLTNDTAQDDFEERDLIFARISNLVTVRSDVFTAYILVRIGTDGPQKRVIAIFDRSDVYSPTDRVKVVAVHPVADPR